MNTLFRVVPLLVLLFAVGESKVLSKDDCVDLWNLVGGRGDVFDSLRKVQTKGIASDQNSIVSLWEACLRMEEGIRFRRSEMPSIVPVSGNGALLRYMLASRLSPSISGGNTKQSSPFMASRQDSE